MTVSFLTVIIATNTAYYSGVFKMNPALQQAQQIMDQIWSAPVLAQVHQAIFQMVQGIQNLAAPESQSGNRAPENPTGNRDNTLPVVGAQVWDLTNDAGQKVTVIVQPFTYSGAFSETSSSAGWWCNIPGVAPIRLPVSGNIVHTGHGDRWDFTITVMHGRVRLLLQGSGTANGNFPFATGVMGRTTGTVTTPTGPQTVNNNWQGTKR